MDYFWESDGWFHTDKHLLGVRSLPFQRKFPEFPKTSGLFVVRGPRQIGKSSFLKTLLKDACDNPSMGPKEAFYLTCEGINDHKELTEVLRSTAHRKLILLDEISFADEWWRAIKQHLDGGTKQILVLTGSHAVDLKKGADLMPGRWGSGREITMMPMLFDEWTEMRAQAGWPPFPTRTEALEAFFRIGGFPTALVEGGPGSLTPEKSKATYWQWLRGDAIKLGKQETYLKEIMEQVAVTTTSAISLQSLAQKTQLGSHNTAQDYVSLLEDCFALRTFYALDPSTGAYRYRKQKKFYFTDPLIYWIALKQARRTPPADWAAKMAETVAANWIWHRRSETNKIGYLATAKNGEIDFYTQGQWAIEVKWAPAATNLSAAYLKDTVPWKRVWTHSNFGLDWPPEL